MHRAATGEIAGHVGRAGGHGQAESAADRGRMARADRVQMGRRVGARVQEVRGGKAGRAGKATGRARIADHVLSRFTRPP